MSSNSIFFGFNFSVWDKIRFGVSFGVTSVTVTSVTFSGSTSVVTFCSVVCSRSALSDGGDPEESTDGLV